MCKGTVFCSFPSGFQEVLRLDVVVGGDAIPLSSGRELPNLTVLSGRSMGYGPYALSHPGGNC